MCYGMVGPISSNLSKLAHEEHEYLQVMRVIMIAFMKGISPLLAVEMGRRAVPAHLRPSFAEFEKHCKQSAAAPAPLERPRKRNPRPWPPRSNMPASVQPIIIKRKGGHAGHHGGAWKVAYADFVTAMMALFIVLWLMNTSKPVQQAIAGYFKDPAGTGKLRAHSSRQPTVSKDDMAKVKAELEKAIQQMTNFDKLKDQIKLTVTEEGLRIELLESQKAHSSRVATPIRMAMAASC